MRRCFGTKGVSRSIATLMATKGGTGMRVVRTLGAFLMGLFGLAWITIGICGEGLWYHLPVGILAVLGMVLTLLDLRREAGN